MKRIQNITPEIQAQIDLIRSQKLMLAEIELEQISDMPNYRQVLRVRDNNIALSQEYLKIIPKRILIHNETGEELDMNLPVVNWERTGNDLAALVDENGERILVETNYYEDEQDDDGNDVLIETTQEPVLESVLQYLMLMIKVKKYAEIFELFTYQYINDVKAVDPDYFKRLK